MDIYLKHVIIKLFLLVFFINISIDSYAQDSRHLYSINSEKFSPDKWKAKWIWLEDVSNTERNHYMLARKSFELSENTSNAILYLTADSHYKLWINGKYITRGPARSNPHHQSYDVLDVSKYLKQGKNTIAVKVHYHGIMKSYYTDPYPGLLVQLEINDTEEKKYIVSDRTWRVIQDNAWDSRTEWVNRVNANNFSSSFNFNLAVPGWYLPDYDSEHWPFAVYQMGQPTWPPKDPDYEPYAIQRPWFSLVPRDIPPLNEYDFDAFNILDVMESPQYSKYPMWSDSRNYNSLWHSMQDVYRPLENSEVINIEEFLNGEAPLIVKNSYPDEKFTREVAYHTTIVFDFETISNGYPYLKVDGSQGSVIDLNYVPYLIDGNFIPGVLVDNWSDRLILSDDVDYWEGTELRTFRYMSATIRSSEPVSLKKIGIRVEEYPFQISGTIEVEEEPFIKDLWKAGEETIRGITTDGYTDNYHENRQYVQTSYYASRGNYATFGDRYLQRRYLIQHAQDQLPNGIMPMWAPWGVYDSSNQMPGIFEANHFWLMALRDYYLFTGDTSTVQDLLISAERCAQAINNVQFENNLVHKPPYPYWIDWAKLAQGDQNFILNSLQLLAFRDYAELLDWLGKSDLSEKWYKEADKIGAELKNFWSEEYGLFADNRNDGKIDQNFSEHANALAIITGVASDDQKQSIIKKLKNNYHDTVMEEAVLFNYWITKALAKEGYIKEMVDFLKRKYQHMVYDEEIGTLWEYANIHVQNVGTRKSSAPDEWSPRSWSASQAENAYPGSTLSHWILGLQPSAPGISEIIVKSLESPYDEFSGSLPSPHGKIKVVRSNYTLQLNIPNGVVAKIPLENLSKMDFEQITVDDETFIISELGEYLKLQSGERVIEAF